VQILLQHLAVHWPMAAELSPLQRREIGELLPTMIASLFSFAMAGITTTYAQVCYHLDNNQAPVAFFAVFLIILGICLIVYENRSVGLSAASVKIDKMGSLRMQSPASGCVIVGLLLLLLLFSRFMWVSAIGHLALWGRV